MKIIPNLFLILYAYIKDVETFKKVYTGDIVLKIFCSVLSSLILLAIGILLVPFMALQFCLYITLKLTYKELYDGFLSGVHAVHEKGQHDTVINVIIVYSCIADRTTRICILKQLVNEIYNSSYKFSCTVQQCLGFLFLLKNQVKTEEILEVITKKDDDYMTKTALYNYIERNCSSINSNRTWKVIGFTQPIDWGQDGDHTNQYVIILSIRHCIGDGFGIFAVLRNIFSKDLATKITPTNRIPFKRPRITLNNAYVHTNLFTVSKDYLLLKNKERSEWNLVTYVEPEPKYILSIKAVKRQLKVDFIDVIGAAVCASIKDYIAQRRLKISSFTMGSMVRVYEEEILQIINKTYDFKKLTNTTSLETYIISFGPEEESMKGKIRFLHRATESLRKSLDFLVPYVALRSMVSYIPINLANFLSNMYFNGTTVAITNLVGFDKSSYRGFSIDDIHFCVPHSLDIGFLYCIFSYEGRMGITLQSGKGYVRNSEELQTILDNTLKYIDQAESEILIKDVI